MFNHKSKNLLITGDVWLKKKLLVFAALILLSAVFICLPLLTVFGQANTNIQTVTPESGVVGTQVNVQGTIDTPNGSYLVYFGDQLVINGTSTENNVNGNFAVPNLSPGIYNINLKDATSSNQSATKSFTITSVPSYSAMPWSTLLIMAVSFTIAIINSGLNRILVSRFVGWEQYKTMQREMSEFRSQQMAAMRAKDQKQIDKLKKKESQVMNMQKKMMKPQLILFALTFSYFLIWPILTGFFPQPVVHVPGFGVQPFFIWYLMCSLFFGTFASRIIGIMPLE
jgi:uncharacterized membrane protein (DUF106 family)